jgi:hypothetical protein
MIAKLFDGLFGCWHSHYSFPITVRRGSQRNAASLLTGTYVVCLDCGKEFPYDWQEMKVLSPSPEHHSRVRDFVAKQAA